MKRLFMILILSACTSVPLTSLPKLSRIDATSTNIAEARVAFRYPDDIVFKEEAAKFHTESIIGTTTTTVDGALVAGVTTAEDRAFIASIEQSGKEVGILRVPNNLVPKLETLLQNALTARNNGAEGSGNMSFEYTSGICLKYETEEPLIADLYVKTSENEGYVHALRNVDLREKAREEGSNIEVCE